jgi:hypothetical protein
MEMPPNKPGQLQDTAAVPVYEENTVSDVAVGSPDGDVIIDRGGAAEGVSQTLIPPISPAAPPRRRRETVGEAYFRGVREAYYKEHPEVVKQRADEAEASFQDALYRRLVD